MDKYKQAKKDFEQAIANSSPTEIKKAKKSYAISAMRFARHYIEPTENQELYNKIYNLVYRYFEKLA